MRIVREIHVTKASELLRQKLSKKYAERGDKAALARELGVRQELVSRWANGERKPSPSMRATLEQKLRINWKLWEVDATEPDVAPAPAPDPHDGKAA